VETPTPIDVGVSLRINPLGYARELSVAGKVMNQRVNRGAWFHAQGIEFSSTTENGVLARFIEFVEQFPAWEQAPAWYVKGKSSSYLEKARVVRSTE
jgi:hypothetical protein